MIKSIRSKVRANFSKIRNFFYWGWKLRDDQNYDYGYVEIMLLMKLTAMRDYFRDYGHLSWSQDENSDERRDWKALQLTIKLLQKVVDFDNGKNILKNDLDRWGEWVHHDEEEGSILSRFRPAKVLTEEEKKQWREEWYEYNEMEGRVYLKYRKLVYKLLELYGRSWWD
jgi:alpha-L-arabinofuranosidase